VANTIRTRCTNAKNADMQFVCGFGGGYAGAATRIYQSLYPDGGNLADLSAAARCSLRETSAFIASAHCVLLDAAHALMERSNQGLLYILLHLHGGMRKILHHSPVLPLSTK
jgi:hypothetical protein